VLIPVFLLPALYWLFVLNALAPLPPALQQLLVLGLASLFLLVTRLPRLAMRFLGPR